jgi:hypothetical protein
LPFHRDHAAGTGEPHRIVVVRLWFPICRA